MRKVNLLLIVSLSLVTTFLFISSIGSFLKPVNLKSVYADSDKVDICHATSSVIHPYVENSPNKSGDVSGHDGHNGPVWFDDIEEDWGDIIPPFTYEVCEGHGQDKVCHNEDYPGKNWTAAGQTIWNNECKIPGEEPRTDVCPNIEGDQLEIPEGYELDGEDCVPIETPSPTPTPTSTNGGGGGVGGGPGEAPVCTNTTPVAPTLLSASVVGVNSIKIQWGKVIGADHYSIFYGPSSGNYPYSVADTGDTDNFVINGLGRACFAVMAVNGCAPGPLSNEVCTGGGQVLGASTLGATGAAEENLFYSFFILGSLLGIVGVRKFASSKVK